jgi:DNA-binding CsgD family transcriptional regulator
MTGLYAERLLALEAMAHYESHYQQAVLGLRCCGKGRRMTRSRCTASSSSGERLCDVLSPDAYQILYGACAGNRSARSASTGERDPNSAAVIRTRCAPASLFVERAGAGALGARGPAEVVEEWLASARDGTLISAPPDWSHLVRLLAIEDVTPRKAHDEQRAVAVFLRQLCARLTGPDGASLGHFDLQHDSAWGRFRIRAYRMPDVAGRREDHVGLLIGRNEPHALALVRGTGASGLSPQQREVALLVAGGKSNQEIARALSLSLNTASYHVKQVFARLKVHSRGRREALLTLAHEDNAGACATMKRPEPRQHVTFDASRFPALRLAAVGI